MRIAGFVAALLFCALAQAQQPAPASNANAQAKELATRLGRERSAEGLETILRAKNLDLLVAYEHGFRETNIRLYSAQQYKTVPLPEDIEALMVRYYADPVVGGPLRTLCNANGTHFRSRALFDLMFAEWRSGKVRSSEHTIHNCALQTEAAGVEAPLLAWLVAADPPKGENKRRIVEFLGKRKYAPAVPALAALLRQVDDAGSTAAYALLAIGTPDAIDAIIERLTALRREPAGSKVSGEITSLAQGLAKLPVSVPLPYARLRAALPENTREYAIPWLRERKDLAAVPDALVLLGDPAYPRALDALVATDSPDVWKKTRAEVERLRQEGRMNDGQYRYASTVLDSKIANPELHFAQKNQMQQSMQLQERRDALVKANEPTRKLRDSNPDGYVAGMRTYLAGLEGLAREYEKTPSAVGARGDIATGYLELGHFLRFSMKRPKDALELYAAAQRNGDRLGNFAVADTLQFDLRDSKRALEEYRKLLAALPATPAAPGMVDQEDGMTRWARRWLAAQVQYLESGKTFSGTLEPEDLGGAVMMLYYGGGGGQEDTFNLMRLRHLINQPPGADGKRPAVNGKEVARILEGLPASSFVLMRTLVFLGSMPDSRSILAFLARRDPAGFASASYFGAFDLATREGRPDSRAMQLFGLADPGAKPNPLLEAKSQFIRERRIAVRPMPKQ